VTNAIEVSDSLSNAEEQIERAAKTIGRGTIRPRVFEAIYYHKTRIKTVSAIMRRMGLERMQVLQNGRHLVKNGIAKAAKKDGETAYEMIDFYHTHKRRILKYAANPRKLADLPTKRKNSVSVTVEMNGRGAARPKAVAVTVDDLDSFSAVRAVKPDGYIPDTISEEKFKRGVQAILGERAEWKDWGGELADLVSTRVVYKGARIGAVFAFKGPGQRGPLVPGKMGKNGDQIQRMYILDGRLFVVQYVGEVKPSIYDLMQSLAVAKSAATGDTIYYAVIDGTDSYRLLRAYPTSFNSV
jgi:hypothetical protein